MHDVGGISGDWAREAVRRRASSSTWSRSSSSPSSKIHIRLEDTSCITENGAENLTAAVPAETEQVYALVKERGVNSTNLAERAAK